MSLESSGSRSGQTPANETLINPFAVNETASGPEMVLQMLDTLVTAQEPFYADYPSYQEPEIVTHHQNHHHHQHITRVMGPICLDATTHTPGIIILKSGRRNF